MTLNSIRQIKGTIVLRTGLHIGAGDMDMRIGGTDNPVIKHPHTQEPYIPGSSVKGKVRALLEMRSGLVDLTGGEPISVKTLKKLMNDKSRARGDRINTIDGQIRECRTILQLFGASGADEEDMKALNLGATRVSFADCPLDGEWKKTARQNHLPFVEVKSENSIDRVTGTAKNPRFTERVPADTRFEFCASLKQMGDDNDLEAYLMEGLKLLEMDALGGSGSRGYGRIGFEFENEELARAFKALDPFERKSP